MRRLIASWCLLFALSGCASSTAVVEQQIRPPDSRQTRLYFTRATGLVGSLSSSEIKVDGQSIGKLENSDTYLSVDRPPGKHTISVYFIGLLATNLQHEATVQLEAGSSHYYEIKQSETSSTATGRPVAGSIPNLFMFYELDPGNGAAAIARLKPVR